MLANGVFTTDGKSTNNPLIGGSSDSLEVTAEGRQIEIPSQGLPNQAGAAITALVPRATWDKLNAQLQQYVATQQK